MRKKVPKCKECKHHRAKGLSNYGADEHFCWHDDKKMSGFLGTWMESKSYHSSSPKWCPLRDASK
ncbi:hypothetical protein L3i20_v236680 [Paenibacillus sp. L3-i20]|nr:hypothetical protein L3i20_v236680 [Paenibacillus sp. L3-i20]